MDIKEEIEFIKKWAPLLLRFVGNRKHKITISFAGGELHAECIIKEDQGRPNIRLFAKGKSSDEVLTDLNSQATKRVHEELKRA